VVEVIEAYTAAIAARLDVRGLLNVQYAVAGTTVYVIEANPRASRTVPFVAKATGVPLAKVATRVMLGATLAELRAEGLLRPSVLRPGGIVAVKEAVLPFSRFPEVDPALGPEMRSTGEVMGIDVSFGRAFHKAELASGTELEAHGTVFLSLADADKPAGIVVAKRLRELGMGIVATQGTADHLARFDLPVDEVLAKVHEVDQARGVHEVDQASGVQEVDERRPETVARARTAVDLIASGKVTLVVNTPQGRGGRTDGEQIRKASILHGVACVTTVNAALVVVQGLTEQRGQPLTVRSLQELHAG
jgi:carbamoyl-phosphate synthase large subunit